MLDFITNQCPIPHSFSSILFAHFPGHLHIGGNSTCLFSGICTSNGVSAAINKIVKRGNWAKRAPSVSGNRAVREQLISRGEIGRGWSVAERPLRRAYAQGARSARFQEAKSGEAVMQLNAPCYARGYFGGTSVFQDSLHCRINCFNLI